MYKLVLFLAVSVLRLSSIAQDTITIQPIMLTASLMRQSLLRTTSAAAVVDSTQISLGSVASPVSILNSVPGIRMEERSPGSYRLSLRGSLLRSPFGVRNVKVYFNEYPLTDAGGNTYLNAVPLLTLRSMDILKGPDGSLFGANSGGVLTLHSIPRRDRTTAELNYGSYGLFRAAVRFARVTQRNTFGVNQDYQRAGGYRENSAFRRSFTQLDNEYRYATSASLSASLFYSDIFYETPGGLTLAQYQNDPRQARQATATLPGAAEQKAAVSNRMLFAGLSNSVQLLPNLLHVFSVFGSSVRFRNPFITNYEERKEGNYGFRTYITVSSRNPTRAIATFDYTAGVEWQRLASTINNYRNNAGAKGALLAGGRIKTRQHFLFNRLRVTVDNKLTLEAGVSVNYYQFRFIDSSTLDNRFKPQWIPRIGANYLIATGITIRGTISKGYSPPTTAEIRPSDNNFYRDLQAEKGVNFEVGTRLFDPRNRFWLDVAAFRFRLKDAIVRQQNIAGDEFFTNAGTVNQRGLEINSGINILDSARSKGYIKSLQLRNGSTFSDFKFGDYRTSSGDYSGNRLTGVPKRVIVTSVFIESASSLSLFLQHNYTARLPLNDANEFYADSYNLWLGKLGYRLPFQRIQVNISAGVDNILNERYSLGNDINAAGNRFYNAAPERNYFVSLQFGL